MIGDQIHIRPEYYETADALVSGMQSFAALESVWQPQSPRRLVVLIGGESGSGKSVTAVCLAERLSANGLPAAVLHQDDYFLLPPHTNHEARMANIDQVGPGEVNLALLQEHLDAFAAGAQELEKPLVIYAENRIASETLPIAQTRALVIEGTYAMLLERADFRVFMMRDYRDTQAQRIARGREAQSDFIETVLAREHAIIAPMHTRAHARVRKDYSVQFSLSV